MANAVITTASSSLGSSGLASLMTVLADEFIRSKRNKGRILTKCNTTAELIPGPHQTARFILAPCNLTVSDEVDGTTPNKDDTVGTHVDITLNVHKSVVFGYSEVASALDGGRALPAQYAGRMASLFNVIEQDVAALASTFATNIFGAGNTPVTEAVFDNARASLINAQVPDGEPIHGFWSPGSTSWVALSNLPAFREYRITGRPMPQIGDDFGETPGTYWKNVTHHESQNVKTTGAPLASNFMFHKDALLIAMKAFPISTAPGVEMANFRDPDSDIEFQIIRYWEQSTGAEVIKIHALYGKSIGRDEWGVVVQA